MKLTTVERKKETARLKEEAKMSKIYDQNTDCADFHCSNSDKDDVLYVSIGKNLKQNNIPTHRHNTFIK